MKAHENEYFGQYEEKQDQVLDDGVGLNMT